MSPRRRRLRRRRSVAPLWSLRERRQRRRREVPAGRLAPIASVTTPTATASSSERTGAHLTVRLSITAIIVVSLFAALVVRLWSLQVIQGPLLNNVAEAITHYSIELPAPRGEILARNGQVLADNVASPQITLNEVDLDQNPSVAVALSDLLGVSAATITAAVKNVEYAPLGEVPVPTGPAGVTDDDINYILTNPSRFPGVIAGTGYVRSYPQGALASQVIGYTQSPKPGVESGATGLENEYNAYMEGKPGSKVIEKTVSGVPAGATSYVAATPGDNISTNLDLGVEQTLQNALSNQVASVRAGESGQPAEPAVWAAGVVMKTDGEVLAMASYPGFNDNVWEPGISPSSYQQLLDAPGSPLNDYAISGLQPPGSTFKLATATAALDDGIISPGTDVDDTGQFTFGTSTYTDNDSEALGEVDLPLALTESSDYYFYNIGAMFWDDQSNPRYGPTPIQNTAKAYGIGAPSGIDLPGAMEGQVDSPRLRLLQHGAPYYGGDNVEVAIGQGETDVTPLDMADAYATFLNHGTRYAPEVAHAIVGPSGKVIETLAPRVMGHVSVPLSTFDPIYQGFEGAVQDSDGTAYAAFQGFNFNAWNVGGKTGTAQTNASPTGWFVAFGGPKSDPDEYVAAIVVAQGGYGADAAAPVARQVFNYLYAHGVGARTL